MPERLPAALDEPAVRDDDRACASPRQIPRLREASA